MKNIKKIIGSALLATAFAATSVGTTFALFTDEAKTTITVGSGIVNIENSVSLVRYQSSVDGTNQAITGNSYSNELVGNNFSLSGSIVNIEKMVPGDKLTVKLSALNKSNVRTKTRYVVSHATIGAKGDLFPALKFTFNAGETSAADLFKWQSNSAVAEAQMAEGVALYGDDGLLVTIELPDSHNGALTFGSENLDNQYQDKACSISFDLQAVQGNATVNPIDEINAYLQAEKMVGHENHTMHDAVLDMQTLNYTDLSILEGYVYDLVNDQFVAESSVSANYLNYFKTYSSMPDTQSFSIYAMGSGWTTINPLTVGFDAGDVNGITSINYDRSTAENGQRVIIRTNGGTLTVDAAKDTVKHYGYVDVLDIIAVASTSYYENGEAGYVKIANGRLVVEETAAIDGIYLVANNSGEFEGIKLAVVGEAELPELARADVELEVGQSKLVVEVQTLETSEGTDLEPEYVWISKSGTEVSATVSTSNEEEDFAEHVVENPTTAAITTKEAVDEAKEEMDLDSVARIGMVGYESLASAITAAASEDKIVLLKNISITSSTSLSKSITLDLNGKVINSTATLFNIYGNYNLTIKDSVGSGEINTTANTLIYSSGNGSLVKVEGGLLTATSSSSYTYVISIGSGASFKMTGGTLKIPETSTSTYNYCVSNSGAGTITIEGGNILGKASGGNYAVSSSNGNVYISGGYIDAYAYPVGFKSPFTIYMTGSAVAYISGGFIRAYGDKGTYSAGHLIDGNASVSGGYFGGNYYYSLDASMIAEGYQCITNTDSATKGSYKYVVVPVQE